MSYYQRKRDEDILRRYQLGEIDLFTYELKDLLGRLGLVDKGSKCMECDEGGPLDEAR